MSRTTRAPSFECPQPDSTSGMRFKELYTLTKVVSGQVGLCAVYAAARFVVVVFLIAMLEEEGGGHGLWTGVVAVEPTIGAGGRMGRQLLFRRLPYEVNDLNNVHISPFPTTTSSGPGPSPPSGRGRTAAPPPKNMPSSASNGRSSRRRTSSP